MIKIEIWNKKKRTFYEQVTNINKNQATYLGMVSNQRGKEWKKKTKP